MSYSSNYTAPVTKKSGEVTDNSGETYSIATNSSNSSQSNPTTTTGGSNRPENQEASILAAFFDLLKIMKPPALKPSPTESVEWGNLVKDLHEMYKGYLTTLEYIVGHYKSMTNDTQYFGGPFSASFGRPDGEGRFVTLTFTLTTDGSYAGSDGVRQAMHKEDDETFLGHRMNATGSNGDALGMFKRPTKGSVVVKATPDDCAAWWRACTPYDGYNLVVYYGVIEQEKIQSPLYNHEPILQSRIHFHKQCSNGFTVTLVALAFLRFNTLLLRAILGPKVGAILGLSLPLGGIT
ncbi:hypothetical protein FFLO_06860 [Filobasidium floriforme]|uniref:Uncharacterized protein n=1 Tax=Filobasidium floriforme TaxID=5210 RepID=A0A8K0NMF9_9TREE|nr:uncharacterized protein HD553DRAFT_367801 [Filobasidium floriforme]KAG7527514.1 hypothetical protein FFLO_06860 [Filobasidium floriforme]KAH8087224.1 hypothetical protein HD553DRAFT_367801 [Filobasidium floriforme]